MDILISLIPALAWGVMPLAVSRIGGKPANQIMGSTAGTFLIACIVLMYLRPEMDGRVFALSMLSGAAWVLGQLGQFQAYTRIGVARTMPVSTALQLVGTSIIGVFFFAEWGGALSKTIGFIALGVIVIGTFLTALKTRRDECSGSTAVWVMLFLTNFGYLTYSSIPAVIGTNGQAIFFPQALGMILAALAYVVFSKQSAVLKDTTTWKHILSGTLFAIAALTYIISAQRIGIATGFILSQLSVVISTLGGILFLHERKNKLEMKATVIGLLLIIGGAAVTAFL